MVGNMKLTIHAGLWAPNKIKRSTENSINITCFPDDKTGMAKKYRLCFYERFWGASIYKDSMF